MIADWKHGPHRLTYRQTERTFGLVADALGQGRARRAALRPAAAASATTCSRHPSRTSSRTPAASLAVDWTDLESFSRPPPARHQRLRRPRSLLGPPQEQPAAQPGRAVLRLLPVRRHHDARGERPAVPELARRATLSSCRHDPVRAFVPVLTAMPAAGIPLGDILADSGYAHRDAAAWALPLRAAGAAARPGPAPARPRPQGHPRRRHHRQREPLLPGHTPPADRTRAARPRRHPGPGRRPRPQDRRARPLQARPDHRRRHRRLPPGPVPRRHGQDPLPAPARLDDAGPGPARDPHPPEHPPACCTQQTITVPPDVLAKTAVAVGTALAGGPPHRSQRAGLPHWAPTSGA